MNLPLSIVPNDPHAQAPDARRTPAATVAAPTPRPHSARRLIDSHGRTIRDLRLSITDRCNFRCVYCMDPGVRFMAQDGMLTPEELVRAARLCVGLGIEKIRITGGEPTLHPRLLDIIRSLRAIGPVELALTTNGSLVTQAVAAQWKSAGLDRVTVSIDAVDAATFRAITRSPTDPAGVVAGAIAAMRAGLGPIKLNAVIVRGQNEQEIPSLAALARRLNIEMRFIEFMPLDSSRTWDPGRLVACDEIVSRIERHWPLRPIGRQDDSATALRYEFADGAPGTIGVIAPVSRPFCGACSRLRITADGMVRPCLFSTVEHDLRSLLRSGASDATIEDFLLDATWGKQRGHGISAPGFVQPQRSMSAIGG